MARASAWLALALGALQVGVVLYSRIKGAADFNTTFYLDVYAVLPGLLSLAGGGVVLLRVKPGLRLLSAAWAYIIGVILASMSSAIAQYVVLTNPGPLSTKVGEPAYEQPFPIKLAQLDTLVLIVAVIGLGLALLARRPHHKN